MRLVGSSVRLSGMRPYLRYQNRLVVEHCIRQDARVEVEKIIGRGSGFVAVEIPFTPRAKRVLELSLEEARQLGAWPCPSFRAAATVLVVLAHSASCHTCGHDFAIME